ncbi:pheromone A receptor-domain-containing protein [Mycena leptocephala]|nr:pheromone A receptor-domain-containing protein [Mycena leptocephala]
MGGVVSAASAKRCDQSLIEAAPGDQCPTVPTANICYLGETYETLLAVVLPPPPILIGAVSAVYCVSIKSSYHSRAQFRELLSASPHANLNLNRYVRLLVLAATDLLLTVPLASFVPYSNVAVIGLSHAHAASVETLQWATVACALLFFAYFGFADEAIKITWSLPVCGEEGGVHDSGLGITAQLHILPASYMTLTYQLYL